MPRPKKVIEETKKEALLAAAAISMGAKAKKDILDDVEKKADKKTRKKVAVVEIAAEEPAAVESAAEEKSAVKKSTTTKKSTAKKADTAKAGAAEEKGAVEEKSEAKKSTATKKTSAAKKNAEPSVKANIELQFGDKSVSYDALVQDAKNKYQYDMGGDADKIKSIELYVKPEEYKVYFVIDGVSGDFEL